MNDATEGIAPIRAESTAELIAGRLREAIAYGLYPQGRQLVEGELSESFEVGRGVLREALQRLAQEGLLVTRPNRGVFVAELGPDEISDIYTARLAVERAACLKVIDVTGHVDELARALDELTDELEECAATGSDGHEMVRLDIEFHELIVARAESPRLNRMYDTLATESRMCLSAFESKAYSMPERLAEHRAIARAIRERDGMLLQRLLARHMDHAVAMIVQHLEEEAQARS